MGTGLASGGATNSVCQGTSLLEESVDTEDALSDTDMGRASAAAPKAPSFSVSRRVRLGISMGGFLRAGVFCREGRSRRTGGGSTPARGKAYPPDLGSPGTRDDVPSPAVRAAHAVPSRGSVKNPASLAEPRAESALRAPADVPGVGRAERRIGQLAGQPVGCALLCSVRFLRHPLGRCRPLNHLGRASVVPVTGSHR